MGAPYVVDLGVAMLVTIVVCGYDADTTYCFRRGFSAERNIRDSKLFSSINIVEMWFALGNAVWCPTCLVTQS